MKARYYLFALLIIVTSACKNNKKDVHSHAHDEQLKELITIYESGIEVFAEADPFIIGEKSDILAHFTYLKNFKPLKNAQITAILNIEGTKVSQLADKSIKDGIYRFSLTPSKAGFGKLSFVIKDKDSETKVKYNGILVYSNSSDADHSHSEDPINSISFTKEQSWKIDFATSLPQKGQFGPIINTYGKIENSPMDEYVIIAKSSGLVKISFNDLLVGSKVNQGEMLFTINSSEMANKNLGVEYIESKNNFETAKEEYERLLKLEKEQIVSKQRLAAAKNNYLNSKAVYENYKNQFQGGSEIVKSPASGFIRNIHVSNGQYAEAGTPLISLTKTKNLVIHSEVSQEFFNLLPLIKNAVITSSDGSKKYTLEELNGKVSAYGQSTNYNNHLIPISLKVENRGQFIPGSIVEVVLKAPANSESISISNDAIIEEQGDYFVFVQINPESFEKRQIQIGKSDGLFTEVISGLSGRERIVSKGAIFLKLSAATNALDAHSGHVH